MTSIQIKSEISVNELLSSVEQLNSKEIDKLIKKLVTLQIRRQIPQPAKIEVQLIKKITKKLSKAKQAKYEKLTQKRIEETISVKELNELTTIIDLIEKIEAEKAQAIFTLSQIKGTPPEKLMKSLKLS